MLKKRTYWRLVVSFLCIIAFSITSGLFIYSKVYGMLVNEISKSNASSLNQLSHQFDAKILAAKTVFSNIISNPKINQYALDDRAPEMDIGAIFKIHTLLTPMRSSDCTDIFIYFKNSDRVVSANYAAYKLAKYYMAYYKSDSFDYSQLKDYLSTVNFSSIKSFGSAYDVAVIQSIPFNKLKNPPANLVCKFDRSAIANMLNRAKYSKDSVIAVVNSVGEIVTTTDTNYELVKHIDFSQIDETTDYHKLTLHDMEYIVQIVDSDYSRCSFISLVPVSVFWGELKAIQLYLMLSSTAYLFIGVFIAILLSRRNYRPFSLLISDINKKITGSPKSVPYDEMDFLRDTFNTALDESKKYEKSRQSELLIRAIKGVYPHKKNIFVDFKLAGINIQSDRFFVMVIRIDDWGSLAASENLSYNEMQFIEPILHNSLTSLCSNTGMPFVIINSLNVVTSIINLTDSYSDSTAYEISCNLQAFLKKEFSITCTISYSSEHRDWQGIKNAYIEAEQALQYRCIYGTGSILPYKFARLNVRGNYDFDSRGSAERLISLYIMNGDSAPKEILQQIVEESCRHGIQSPKEFQCYFYDMNNLFSKITERMGFPEEVIYDLNFCETLPQFNEELERTLIKFHRLYQQINPEKEITSKEKEIFNKIIEYINENYSNPDLSMGDIGDLFGLNASYLSRRFKTYYDVSIFDFLTNTRIEKAKKFLTETDYNISQIAETVGFNSSVSLIRAFKKSESITPGEYRKVYKKKEA